MPDFLLSRWDWPSTIGSFMLLFNTLDYTLSAGLLKRLGKEEFEKIRNEPFQIRLKAVARHLKSEEAVAGRDASVDALAKRLETLRQLRNHLAHGFFSVIADKIDPPPEVTITQVKDFDQPGARRVTFQEIQSAVESLPNLIEEIHRFFGVSTTNITIDRKAGTVEIAWSPELSRSLGIKQLPPTTIRLPSGGSE